MAASAPGTQTPMLFERIAVGIAAALWAAVVPGGAHVCLDHHWELPRQWLRRRLADTRRELDGRVAHADAGSIAS